MGGTMGSRGGYHGCPMGRIPKPPGPQGTLGPLGPQGLIGPQGLMAPQGTQGSGFMVLCMSLATRALYNRHRKNQFLNLENRFFIKKSIFGARNPQNLLQTFLGSK